MHFLYSVCAVKHICFKLNGSKKLGFKEKSQHLFFKIGFPILMQGFVKMSSLFCYSTLESFAKNTYDYTKLVIL